MFSDARFNYFVTIDGYLYRVERDLNAEAAEARFARSIYWIRLLNWALICLVWAIVMVDLVALVCLIGGVR